MRRFLNALTSRRREVRSTIEPTDLTRPIDLLGAHFIADPYPTYAALRAQRPVAQTASGGIMISRHADVMAALSDARMGNTPSRFATLNARNRQKYPAADLAAHIPPFLDMPEHRVPRQALTRCFFDVFKPFTATVQAEAERCVAQFSGASSIQDIARPFALTCMARFIGLPADLDRLKDISQAFFHLFAPITDPKSFSETNQLLSDARDFVAAQLASVRERESPGLIGALSAYQTQEPELSDQHIVDNAILVLADGIENIEAGAASLMMLLDQESWLDRIVTDRDLAEPAVREGLRLQTPAQLVPRVAREAFVLMGQEVTEGMPILLALGSANRDPAAVDRPDEFRPDRAEKAVTFGLGRHRCIGEPLGVLLLTEIVVALVNAGIRPALSSKDTVGYQRRFGHRWPDPLPFVRR